MGVGIIYIRINNGSFEELLEYQESKLLEIAGDIKIADVIFDIGPSYTHHERVEDRLEYYILNELVDHLFVYSPYRLSTDHSVIEEFEMLCRKHNVSIKYYKDYLKHI